MGCGLYKLDRIRELDYWAGMSHQYTCIWLMPHGLMNPPLSVAAAGIAVDDVFRHFCQLLSLFSSEVVTTIIL